LVGVTGAAVVSTVDAVARLGAHGLPGVDPEPITLDDPDGVLAVATTRQVLPWVAAAVADGCVSNVSDEWRADLHRRRINAVQTTMAVHLAAVDVIERLAAAGSARARILKGCATGHLDYDRAVDRPTSDVDLLLHPDDRRTFVTNYPGTVASEPWSESWSRRYGKAITMRSPIGVEIDVHTMLSNGYFGMTIPIEELFDGPVDFAIAGVAMQALNGPNRLIHAAIHVAASPNKGLHSMRDVLQLVLVSEVDWEESIRRAERWNNDVLFARGVIEAWDAFPVPTHPLVEWARSVNPHGRQRAATWLADGRHGGQLLTGPLALPVHRWPGYLLPMVFPSREFLADTDRTLSGRYRRLAPLMRRTPSD
jgi:hypothetical protein